MTRASTTNWASAGTSSRVRHSAVRSLRATAIATAMLRKSGHHTEPRGDAHDTPAAQRQHPLAQPIGESMVVRGDDRGAASHDTRKEIRAVGAQGGIHV